MIEATAVTQHVLPAAWLEAAQADAEALAQCPNYWVPRDVVDGRQPAIAAAEQVVAALYRRLVAPRLAPHDASWTGAEYWCQVYEGGRGLGFHFDKDEHAMKEEGRMATPLLSSVYYLTGSQQDAPRQAPTVLIDQAWDYELGCPQPDCPAWSAFVFPVTNQYCLFNGAQAHGVLEAVQAPGAPRRAVLLVNWWALQPQGVARAAPEDVAAGKLAAALAELEPSPEEVDAAASAATAAGSDDSDAAAQAPAMRQVEMVCIDAPVLQPGEVLPVDELLKQRQVSISGSTDAIRDAVLVRHQGLTLYPLDEEQVEPGQPMQVLAALVPAAELASGSSSGPEEEGVARTARNDDG